jgi:hypothetical protein
MQDRKVLTHLRVEACAGACYPPSTGYLGSAEPELLHARATQSAQSGCLASVRSEEEGDLCYTNKQRFQIHASLPHVAMTFRYVAGLDWRSMHVATSCNL